MHHGYTQAEGVANLEGVPATGCLVGIGYPKFKGGVGGYARYVAICPLVDGEGRIDLARRGAAASQWKQAALGRSQGIPRALMLELFPDTARVEDGELTIGGVRASALAEEYGTPLVVYCEETVRSAARAWHRGAGDAVVVYGTKAFPNVALVRVLAGEGIGADVSTLGELRVAQTAGVPPSLLVVHGNNKSDEELAAAAEADAWLVVMDEPGEVERCVAAGVKRVLLRITPGVDADTHEKIRTGHAGSKFGVAPEEALAIVERAQAAGLEMLGLHVHLGSQVRDTDATARPSSGSPSCV